MSLRKLPPTFTSSHSLAEKANPAKLARLRFAVIAGAAITTLLLVVSFAAYGMVVGDRELLASVWGIVRIGAGVLVVWALGDRFTHLVTKSPQ
jgi:hypothetical protein